MIKDIERASDQRAEVEKFVQITMESCKKLVEKNQERNTMRDELISSSAMQYHVLRQWVNQEANFKKEVIKLNLSAVDVFKLFYPTLYDSLKR